MAKEGTPAFNTEILRDSLRVGEQLLDPPGPYEGDLREKYGYQIYPIQDITGEKGNSVFLVMEKHGDGVEPVELVGDVTLTIRPVMGEGIVVVNTPGLGVSPNLLTADGSPNDGGPVELVKGESYAYLNTGEGPFIVRDDSYPGFRSEYEIPAVAPGLLQALAELGLGAVEG